MKEYEVILLCQWGTNSYGDIVKVAGGIYNTMIYKGMAIELVKDESGKIDYSELDNYETMVIHSKMLIEENENLFNQNEHLQNKNDRLTEKIEDLMKLKDNVKK